MENEPLPVQTRDEEGNLRYFPTVVAAMLEAQRGTSIWKVSFDRDGERIRLVRDQDGRFFYSALTDEVRKALGGQ